MHQVLDYPVGQLKQKRKNLTYKKVHGMTSKTEYCFYGVIVVAILLFAVLGKSSSDENAKQEAVRVQSLESLVVPQTIVDVDFSGAKLLGAVTETGGRYSTMYRYWTGVQTKDWMLANSASISRICGFLNPFVEGNKLDGVAISPESMDVVLSALEGKTAQIGVYIPRFVSRPKNLSNCPGMSYDETTRTLKVGSRSFAVLADRQPGLIFEAAGS